MTDEQRAALKALIKDSWQTAEDHGWHQDEELYREVQSYVDEHALDNGYQSSLWQRILKRLGSESSGVQVMEKLMLATTELAEAAEIFRKAGIGLCELYWTDEAGVRQPATMADAKAGKRIEGFASEAVDTVIRLFDLSMSLGIPFVEAFELKSEQNRHRPFRHGNKRA